jgi:hypothetical protein
MEISSQGHGAKAVAPDNGQVSSEPVAQETSSRYFRTLVGQTLTARTPQGVEIELRLDALNLPGLDSSNAIEPGDSFALRFSGPADHLLPPSIAELTPSGAEPMEIFVVPLGPRHGYMEYEAVFNRATPIS